jgi:hypothetical protein
MITILNRRELTITFSMEQLSKIKAALDSKQINYIVKTINRNSPSVFSDTRARNGSLGQNMNMTYEYIIYVHKNDYDYAQSIL